MKKRKVEVPMGRHPEKRSENGWPEWSHIGQLCRREGTWNEITREVEGGMKVT